jgi:glucuronoarabinoxylan endo-1,4-beta-xylanase
MTQRYLAKAATILRAVVFSVFLGSCAPLRAQVVYLVDEFDPSGAAGYSYAAGGITNVWDNWFGDAFQSLSWDPTSDASNNPTSGSMEINVDFNGLGSIPNQFEVYDGFNGVNPAINGLIYTNFQCDVRFAAGSANSDGNFGYLQFGIAVGYGQDYFGGLDVPSSNTNWVHVSINLDANSDPNLQSINDVLIHIYGPDSNPGLSGPSTLWIDNIKFVGSLPVTTNCVVDWNNVHQEIDGFGASSAWESAWTTNQADLFFSTNLGVVYSDNLGNKYTNNGVGLSLLRNRIAPAASASASDLPTTVETQLMQWAQARGARVWSTPWTPPAGFKSTTDIYDTNQSTDDGLYGGSFKGGSATNLAYASQLANYVASMKNTYGVNLYAISIQNEPDSDGNTYEHCQWSNTDIHDFVTNLYNALVAQGVGATKIMLPESQNWQDYQNLAGPALTDPNVLADVGILGDHNYDGPNGPSPLTVAQANAWHYWWLGDGLLDTNYAPSKRLFTIGNYSRFVRPGSYAINVANNNSLTSISAFKDPVSGNFAIVAVNPEPVPVTQIFNLTNFTANSVTPWITSAGLSLASQAAVSVTNGTFAYVLPAMSVVSFVGRGFIPPTNIAISSVSYNPSASALVLTWNSTAGATYSVYKTNQTSGSRAIWPIFVTGYPSGGAAGTQLSCTDTTATARSGFYRVSSP